MKRAERKSGPLALSETRRDFAAIFDRCFLCGTRVINAYPPVLCTHEIARGPDRQVAKDERCCLIRTCARCHESRLNGMPVVRQLAIKKIADHQGYDRKAFNIIRSAHNLRGPQPEAITEAEVDAEVAVLEGMIKETGTGWPFPRWSWN